jgi:hypothetical protein
MKAEQRQAVQVLVNKATGKRATKAELQKALAEAQKMLAEPSRGVKRVDL